MNMDEIIATMKADPDLKPELVPTPEQEAIINAAVRGESFMAIAGAGSAKTTTIKMFAPKLQSTNVLAVAFNKRIVEDLVKACPEHFTIKTLNSIGHSAWAKQRGGQLKLDTGKLAAIVTEVLKDKAPLLRIQDEDGSCWTAIRKFVNKMRQNNSVPPKMRVRAPRFVGPDPTVYLDEFLITEDWDTGIMSVDEMLGLSEEVLCRSINQAFAKTIDFEDQIYMSTSFFCPYTQYDTVLVDEAQDLSPANHMQLMLCKPKQLIAVGDPKQAIYAFRGADRDSMANLKITASEMLNLDLGLYPLATSFRCPKLVAERQKKHYPEFKAFEGNIDGTIDTKHEWTLAEVNGAVICRNNAPLVALAFQLLRSRKGFTFYGLDMAKNLKGLIKKIAGKTGKDLSKADLAIPADDLLTRLGVWYNNELARLKSKDKSDGKWGGDLKSTLQDRKECARMIISESKNLGEAMDICDNIFDKSKGQLVLTSGHRSKGFEWTEVWHLDPHRLPSKYALNQARQGYPGALYQEENLLYVIETRTKDKLFMIQLDECTDQLPEIEDEES